MEQYEELPTTASFARFVTRSYPPCFSNTALIARRTGLNIYKRVFIDNVEVNIVFVLESC